MLEIETLHSFDTEYSADSVEWCHQSDHQQMFAVGTYQLEEKEESSSSTVRKGRMYLFSFDEQRNEIAKRQQLETDAILDQKWKEIDNVDFTGGDFACQLNICSFRIRTSSLPHQWEKSKTTS